MVNQDRIYLELRLSKSIETDESGNVIFEAEASNENLDFDGQVVLQEALIASKDYFLANGVVSYDHKHLKPDPLDPHWNPEKYIIGEPLEVRTKGNRTFVKGKLYSTVESAQEIIKKLKAGAKTLHISVGGKMPQVEKTYSQKLGKMIEAVVAVLWDEIAITFKPVNQTLDPVALSGAAFVKSLQAGLGTDSSAMTGGRAMILQDVEHDRKPDQYAVVMGMAYKDFKDEDDIKQFLKNRGCSPEEADNILRNIIANKDKMKEEVSMDANLLKAFDETTASLEKSLKAKPKEAAREGMNDFPPEQSLSADPETGAGENDEGEGVEDENGEGEPAGKKDKSKDKTLEKSLYDDVRENAGDFLDVAPFLDTLTKSISSRMAAIERQVNGMVSLQKSMGGAILTTAQMVKSIGDTPAPRQAIVNSQIRFKDKDKDVVMTRSEVLKKSQELIASGKMDLVQAGAIEERLNKSLPLSAEQIQLLK